VESIAKPHKPRPHSQSPMRNQKPSSTDDQGDLPLAQPNRAFGLSPGGSGHPNGAPFIHLKESSSISSSDIQLPDLSKITIPDIGAHHNGSGGDGGGLFTPPARSSSNNGSFIDDPMSAYPIGSSGLKPRSAFQVDELFGGGGGNSTTNNGRNHPIPKFPPPSADNNRSPSPMDMEIDDETPPAVPTHFSLGQQPPRNGRRPNPPRKTASSSSAKLPPPTTTNPINNNSSHISIGNHNNNADNTSLAFINAKREEARNFFGCKNYRSSIQAYTQALQSIGEATMDLLPRDTYAVLLSNRAACLLMVGAYDAAVADCTLALEKVKMPLPKQPFSNDGGYMLKVKLYTRLGRSYMKLGLHAESTRAFDEACQTADIASDFTKANHSKDECRQNLEFCLQIKTDAALGKSDAKRLKDACDNLTLSMQHILYGHAERTQYADALGHVNLALSMATGSVKLIESKLSILSYMKRWREVAGFCERLAACNVLQDGIFVDDLADYNPFPGVPPARYLKADFFKNTRDEDATTRDLKLTSRAAAEAVIRLPIEIAPTYIRALRLEERYPAGDAAIQSLEELKTRQGVPVAWLGRERAKLALTKSRREEADELFRSQAFELASQKYTECLVIDRDGNGGNDPVDGLNAGGRLHAVLHCNLAACLMARGLHKEAVEECTNALRIHGRYMKAILRRARCYSRLQQSIESISEYRRWLNLVEDRSETSHNAACIFDGPQDVKDAEIAQVKEELDNVQKAKRRNEVKAKDEAERRRAQQRSNFQENFSTSWRSTSGASAQQRRENFYANQQQQPDYNSNNWDSFSGRGGGGSTARSNSNPRPRPHNNHPEGGSFRSNSQGRASPRSATDHYATLEIPRSASEEDIKKAYRRMALKYHPDKNKDSNAGDHFRRVKLAHDVLSDPVKRREYDGHRRPY
jgi:tetratricopeptide (TPR) repeat protein